MGGTNQAVNLCQAMRRNQGGVKTTMATAIGQATRCYRRRSKSIESTNSCGGASVHRSLFLVRPAPLFNPQKKNDVGNQCRLKMTLDSGGLVGLS